MDQIRLSLAIQTPDIQQTLPVALLSGDFTEKVRKAAEFGADGVELLTVLPATLVTADILSVVSSHGLSVAAIATGGLASLYGLTLLNQDAEKASMAQQRLYEMIDLAAQLSAGIVTIGSFRGRASTCDGDAFARLAEILYPAAIMAAEYGIRLALEPLNRYESDLINNHQEGLAFLEHVNHPSLGLLLDTFHMNIEETSWTEPLTIVLAAGKLSHLHLGDNNRMSPGDGLIDFPSVVKTLREGNYHGYLSAELLARPDPDIAASRTLAYMRKVMS